MRSFGMVITTMLAVICIKIPEFAAGASNSPVTEIAHSERTLQLQNISEESFSANPDEYFKTDKDTRDNLVHQDAVNNSNIEATNALWMFQSINNLSDTSDNSTHVVNNTNNSTNLEKAFFRNNGQDESMENRLDHSNAIPIINSSKGVITYMVIPTLQISEWKRHMQDDITHSNSDYEWANEGNNILASVSHSVSILTDYLTNNMTVDQNYLGSPLNEENSTNSIGEIKNLQKSENYSSSLVTLPNEKEINSTSIYINSSLTSSTFTPLTLRFNSEPSIANYLVAAEIHGSYLPDEIVHNSNDLTTELLFSSNSLNSIGNASNVLYLTKIDKFSDMDKILTEVSANISYIQNNPPIQSQVLNNTSHTFEEIHPTPTYKGGFRSNHDVTEDLVSSLSIKKINYTKTEANFYDHIISFSSDVVSNLTSVFVPSFNNDNNSYDVMDKVKIKNIPEFNFLNDSSRSSILQTTNSFSFNEPTIFQSLLPVPLRSENIINQKNNSENGTHTSDLDNYILSMDFSGHEEGNLRISLSGRVFWLKPTAVSLSSDKTILSKTEIIQTNAENSYSNEILTNSSIVANHIHKNSLLNIIVSDKIITTSPILESSLSEITTIKFTVTEPVSSDLIVTSKDLLMNTTSSSQLLYQSNFSMHSIIDISPSLSDNFISVNVSLIQNPLIFSTSITENSLNTSLNDILLSKLPSIRSLSANMVYPTIILNVVNVSSNLLHINHADQNPDEKINSTDTTDKKQINEIQSNPIYNNSHYDFKLHLENKQLTNILNESTLSFNIGLSLVSQREKLFSNTVYPTTVKHDVAEGDMTIPVSQEDYILDEDTRIDEGIMDFFFTSPQSDEPVEGDKNPLDNEVNLDLNVMTTPSLEHDIQFIFPLPEHEQPSAEPPFDVVETNSLENLDNTIKQENSHSDSPGQNEKNIIFSKNVSINVPEWPVINKHFTVQTSTNTEDQQFTNPSSTTETNKEAKVKNLNTNPGYTTTAFHPTELPPVFSMLKMKLPQSTICHHKEELQQILSKGLGMVLNTIITTHQIKIFASEQPWSEKPMRSIPLCHNFVDNPPTMVLLYIESADGSLDEFLTRTLGKQLLQQNIQLSGTIFENQILEVQIYPREEEKKTPSSANYSGTVAAITIAGIAGTCLMLLCILLVVMKLNHRKARRCHPALDNYSLDSLSLYSTLHGKKASVMSHTYLNHGFEDSTVLSHQVNFAGLANICCDQDLTLEEEFKLLPATKLKLEDLPEGVEEKNRYSNIIPVPETRVLLSNNEDEAKANSDYINANFVRGYHGLYNEYVACQAPMENTTADFWQMIWEQQSKVIIALNSKEEGEMLLSAPYLPKSQVDCHRLFGDFQITLKAKETLEKYIISTIILRNLEKNLMREIVHFWYTAWPAKGVPDECWSILAMLLEVRPLVTKNSGPIIVHCATGTGRTGTVIAIDICIREFEKTRMVDVPKSVYRLRQDRSGAVQTSQQYAYIYQVLNEYAIRLITPSL